jgi:hypothetical protein
MGPTGCPETSVRNYLSALCTLTEGCRPQGAFGFNKNAKKIWVDNVVCLMHNRPDAALMVWGTLCVLMEQWYKLHLQKTHTVLASNHFEFLGWGGLFTFRIFWRPARAHSCTAESISSFFINIGNLTPNSTMSWLRTPEFVN